MKKLSLLRILAVVLLIAGAVSAYAQEPDPRLAGVWKRHISGPGKFEYDRFIRVDIDKSRVFVAMKEIGTDDDGKPFQRYKDARNITVNSDSSVSFITYISERDYDKGDRLYWTVWYSYTIRAESGRLNVTEWLQGYGANSQGRIIEDERNRFSPNHHTYFNINDNW